MPFGVGGFGSSSNQNFDGKFQKKFEKQTDFSGNKRQKFKPRAFDFEPVDKEFDSETKFYNTESLWSRWRRGYDLYSITQTYLGTSSKDRNTRGDFRMYCAFQQFPGVFIPARVFTFPSSTPEIGEQMVGIRDTNSFSFYNFGLPIDAVRYTRAAVTGTYSQSGTTITVTVDNHGFSVGDDIYLDFTTGNGIDATLAITAVTTNTFDCTAAAAVTTSGNVTCRRITTFTDLLWAEMRVEIRFIPTPVNFFAGERLADRVIERDTGIVSTYSQAFGVITINCGSSQHGLTAGNEVLLVFTTGSAIPGLYKVASVTNNFIFTVTALTGGSTSGVAVLTRRLRDYDYEDYVGYTVTGTDQGTKEIIFKREDSYQSKKVNDKQTIITPATRGFTTGRYLTTELRYQCSCPDFVKRKGFNLYSESQKKRFPITEIGSVKPGERLERDGSKDDVRDDAGVFADFGFMTVNDFFSLPTYEDTTEFSYPNMTYYQMRWCKHIYAAMWSIVHDEGNELINITARYEQDGGPNITIDAVDHGLGENTRVICDFTSGLAVKGEFIVTEVVNKDQFKIIYPIDQTTAGYVKITNLKNHEYVGAWLREPNDQPLGIALERFYDNLEKQNDRTKLQAQRMSMMGYGMPWTGALEISGDRNQPEQIGNFNATLISMLLTGRIRRNEEGQLDRDGITQNETMGMLRMMQKVFNINPTLITDVKIGMLDQPLTDYTSDFQFGEIDGGTYTSGVPATSPDDSELDCRSYSVPDIQPILVDCGLYING